MASASPLTCFQNRFQGCPCPSVITEKLELTDSEGTPRQPKAEEARCGECWEGGRRGRRLGFESSACKLHSPRKFPGSLGLLWPFWKTGITLLTLPPLQDCCVIALRGSPCYIRHYRSATGHSWTRLGIHLPRLPGLAKGWKMRSWWVRARGRVVCVPPPL